MVTYRPRCPVHPERMGANRTVPIDLLVIHDSEGGETPTAAENLCAYMATPGDRIVPGSDPPRMYGSSYHAVTDTDLTVIPAVPDGVISYSAGGANHNGLHICIPGKAGQTVTQWLDADSTGHIRACADWLIDKAVVHKVPLVKLTVAQVRAGQRGYCSHWDVSLAFGKSDHTDPGPNFPWAVLKGMIDNTNGEPVVKYFKLASDLLTIWGVGDDLNAVRLEQFVCDARGVNPATVPVITAAEANRYVYGVGLTAQSVK